jgi:hypothetical protein
MAGHRDCRRVQASGGAGRRSLKGEGKDGDAYDTGSRLRDGTVGGLTSLGIGPLYCNFEAIRVPSLLPSVGGIRIYKNRLANSCSECCNGSVSDSHSSRRPESDSLHGDMQRVDRGLETSVSYCTGIREPIFKR